MKFNVQTRVDGQREIRSRFDVIARAPQASLAQIGQEEVARVQHRIHDSKVDPDGTAWAPWSMATIRYRQRHGGSAGGLLYHTGALERSITYTVSEKTLTIKSNVGYARYLQQGTWKMPARRFLGWSQEALNRIKQIIKDAVQ